MEEMRIRSAKVAEAVSDIVNPLRRNHLKQRRRKLGLSRVALARILEVDPATVYRHELQNPMSMLWHYAMVGVETEATSKQAKGVVRDHKRDLDRLDFFPEQIDARGYKVTAEKMREATRQRAAAPPVPKHRRSANASPIAPGRSRIPTPAEVMAAADRAEARSEALRKEELK
jgi:hypothetical protein